MAKLEFFHGVMGSGKGVYIAQMVHNTLTREITPITMKHGIDTKGGNAIVSRIGTHVPVDIMAEPAKPELHLPETDVRAKVLSYIGDRGIQLAHIITDEAQFFSPAQIDQLYALAHHDNVPVTCFGLRADVYRNLFAGSQRLFELADCTTELQSAVRCTGCGDTPNQNGRYIDGLFDINTTAEVVSIDGAKENVVYDVFCNDCYDHAANQAKQGIRVEPRGI
ncbi:MAG: hypothetical protein WAQ25_03490 [Candidatus Saccharimonas sp.]